MSKFSDYLENKIIDHTLKGITFQPIATAYLAAFSTDPTDAASGTECSWTNYARQAMTFGAITDGEVTTSAQLQFPALVGADVTVGWIGIFDAATAGNMLYHTNLANAKTLTVDDVLSFAVSGVTVTLS